MARALPAGISLQALEDFGVRSGSCVSSPLLGPASAERGMPTSPSTPSLRNRLNYSFGGGSHICLLPHCCFYLGHCTLIYHRSSSFNPRRGANLLLLQGRDGSGEITWDHFPRRGVTRHLRFLSLGSRCKPSSATSHWHPALNPKSSLCDCDANLPPQKNPFPSTTGQGQGGFAGAS